MSKRDKTTSESKDKPKRQKREKAPTQEPEKRKKSGKPIKAIIVLAIVLVVALGIYKFYQNTAGKLFVPNEPGKVYTITESELVKVLKESQLYTAEYPYNSYVAVNDDKGNVKYYVAYDGTIKAGFDVNDVTVSISDDKSTITIQLPKISVMDVTVNADSLQYIFEDEKYDTETVASEAYSNANEDLQKKADSDHDIIEAATNNAKMVEKELVEPWVNQVDKEHQYNVVVLSAEEKASNESTTQTAASASTQSPEQSTEAQSNE